MKSLSSRTRSKGSKVRKVQELELALIMNHERQAKIPTSKKSCTRQNLNWKMQIKKAKTSEISLMTWKLISREQKANLPKPTLKKKICREKYSNQNTRRRAMRKLLNNFDNKWAKRKQNNNKLTAMFKRSNQGVICLNDNCDKQRKTLIGQISTFPSLSAAKMVLISKHKIRVDRETTMAVIWDSKKSQLSPKSTKISCSRRVWVVFSHGVILLRTSSKITATTTSNKNVRHGSLKSKLRKKTL